jgi:hypothetical protein
LRAERRCVRRSAARAHHAAAFTSAARATLQHDVAALATAAARLRSIATLRSNPGGSDSRIAPAARIGATHSPRRHAAFLVFVGWFIAVLVLIAAYRSSTRRSRCSWRSSGLSGTSIEKQWVPIERISPNLRGP